MGMSSHWFDVYERICEEIRSGKIEKNKAVYALRRIGLDTGEALDTVADLEPAQ